MADTKADAKRKERLTALGLTATQARSLTNRDLQIRVLKQQLGLTDAQVAKLSLADLQRMAGVPKERDA